jgi:Zn-dependent peptidase ImmA (M78 family)/DNA-binding XRE family transcriptional regulator
MRSGTPGFVGDRLREAREARKISAVTLSELAGVSPQAISQYEKGKSSPSAEVLSRIASVLNLPEHFFTLPERNLDRGMIFYRSMAAATKSARARAERRFSWLRDIVHYLSEFVELPQSNFPDLVLPEDPLLLSGDEIEEAAAATREFWGLRDGPVANMVALLENQGAVVARDQLGAETLDSLSEFVATEGRPYIVIGTDKGTPARWRFDAAHELAHIVLHAHVSPELFSKPGYHKEIEAQAHRFAAAFLLPLGSFGDDLFGANLDNFRSLKLKWNTSIAMMIMRARDGSLISEDTERKLWVSYSRRGWRKVEPHDDTMDVEEPRLLRRSFELVLDQSSQTPEDVLSQLALTGTDVEALSGLPNGFLGEFSRVSLRPSADQGSLFTRTTDTPAQVIPLGPRRRLS